MRKIIAVLLSVFLIGISACAEVPEESSASDALARERPTLVYYTIGAPDRDLAEVNQKLNALVADKIGANVDYRKIGWSEYESRMNLLLESGQDFDIAYALNYAQYAMRNMWLALSPYLREGTVGWEMYQAIDPVFWEGVTISGEIYGVPTNKELAVVEQLMYPKALVEKYDIEITQYHTLESLEPLFARIAEEEPEYLVMQLDKESRNFFQMYGYEYISSKKLLLMVKSLAETPEIVNPFETEEGVNILHTLRKYYLKGYINEDAGLMPSASLSPNQKVFCAVASGGPYSAPVWSRQRKYPIVAEMVADPIVTTESTQAGVMSVNVNTKYPEECLKFLTLINTDPQVRNLLAYGIEGMHYSLDANGQVVVSDTEGYSGVQYTQGNWFILKTLGGEYPEPLDKWAQYAEYNQTAQKSNILGFVPDFTGLEAQKNAVAAVWDMYYPALMTGSVDVETYLPAFLQALDSAGLNEIQEALQCQLDNWFAEKNGRNALS